MIVAALLVNSTTQSRVQQALRGRADVQYCTLRDDLTALVRRRWFDAVIVEPWDATGAPAAPAVAAIRREFPSIPVVVYCSLTADVARELVQLTKAGADDVLINDADGANLAVRRVLSMAVVGRAAAQALVELQSAVPPGVHSILAYCLHHAHEAFRVQDMARALGVHRKTLVNRVAAAGLPSPNTLIAWSRLVLAARLLEDRGRSVEQVALALNFGSGTALRNMLRRHAGLRPGEVRENGGSRCILRLFRRQLAPLQVRASA